MPFDNYALCSSNTGAADRLSQVDNLTSAGLPIAGFAYAYDPAGNRVGVVESAGDRVTWTYDPANQLAAEHRTGVSGFRHTFAYDPAGNRPLKNEDGDRTTFTYDPANRLQRSAALSGLTTYVYDAAGNQRRRAGSSLPSPIAGPFVMKERFEHLGFERSRQ